MVIFRKRPGQFAPCLQEGSLIIDFQLVDPDFVEPVLEDDPVGLTGRHRSYFMAEILTERLRPFSLASGLPHAAAGQGKTVLRLS